MDFSKAEDGAFRDAYVECFLKMGSNHSETTLRAEAAQHIKGCEYHYDESSVRLAKNGNIIPREKQQEFKAATQKLRRLKDRDRFDLHVAYMRLEYPKAASWLDWWLHPLVSPKLFPACKVMVEALWKSLPSTNNAEESMHWQLYVAVGKRHDFLGGLTRAIAWLRSFERLDQAHIGKVGYLSCNFN